MVFESFAAGFLHSSPYEMTHRSRKWVQTRSSSDPTAKSRVWLRYRCPQSLCGHVILEVHIP